MYHKIIRRRCTTSSWNFRSFVVVTLVFMMLLTSFWTIPINIIDDAEAGKYGDLTPTTFELQLLDKINENRSENSAAPLTLNATLWWVARAHSQDMIDYDFLNHTSSSEGQFNGATKDERVNDYAEYENSYLGETIALKTWGIDVESTMASWKDSPSHWEIIINPNFYEIGIGLFEGEWDGWPNAGLHTVVFGGQSVSIDLSINETDIDFNPSSPYEGQEVNISANIHNLGTTDNYPVNVRFYDGDPQSGGIQIGMDQQIPNILIHGENASVSVTLNTTGMVGDHDIYVVVDPNNIITETNEGNNVAFKSLFVNGSNPPIQLDFGWNLISFPYTVSNTSLWNVLNLIDGKYVAVQNYNSSFVPHSWKHYNILKPKSLNSLSNLNNKMGFWILINDNNGTDLVIIGDTPSSPQHISLRSGWNLAGYPSTTSRLRDDALNNLIYGVDIEMIQGFDSANNTHKNLQTGEYMEPGKGYFIYANYDCQWVVDP